MLLLEYYWPLLRLVLRFKSATLQKERNTKMKIIALFQFKKVIRLRFKTITLAAFAVALLSLANCTSFQQDSPFDITGTNYHPPTISAMYDTTVFVGDMVHLHATGSVDNGSIRSYEWSFGNGTTTTTATDDFDTAFSTAGQQTVSVVAVDNNGITSAPSTITVTVQNKPALAVSSSSISIGSNSNSATFSITNAGGGSLQWTISSNTGWLTVSPASGSTTTLGSNITVTANRSGLAAGTYTGNITVTAGGISKVIAVTISVTPVLSVSTTVILLGPSSNSATFSITNTDGGTLSWTISSNANWFSVSPLSGSTAAVGSLITVTANASSSAVGDYSGTITIISGSATKTVIVTKVVLPTTITVTNHLILPILISVNTVYLKTVPAFTTLIDTVSSSQSSMTVSWMLDRDLVGGVLQGESMDSTFPTVQNPTGNYNYSITNVVGNTTYFAPVIKNNSISSVILAVNWGTVAQIKCTGYISASNSAHLGYYTLYSNTEVVAFLNGSNFTGDSYSYWKYGTNFTASDISLNSGGVDLTLNVAP
jgi:hypothetical protein